MTTRHERRAAARFPSSGSVALPLNAIESPTAHVVPVAGVRIVGTGGWLAAQSR